MKRRTAFLFLAFTALAAGVFAFTRTGIPYYDGKERESELYINSAPVVISGYNGSAMEPFISPDGKFLFFNNDEDKNSHSKNLYFAARTGASSFRYLGEVPGVNVHKAHNVDAAPSLDAQGHFFFTSTRQYDKDFHATFAGDFDGKAITHVHAIEGDMNPSGSPGLINMDVSISPDGNTLYISRTRFGGFFHQPTESNLMVAHRSGESFDLDPASAEIMKNVNAAALEYAPDISANGLELYFTRASEPAGLRIMVATRDSTGKPFGMPCVISAARGFVEAPSISLDGKELFFHRKVNDTFVIFRAERNSAIQHSNCSTR